MGYNLNDYVGIDIEIVYFDVVFYDYYVVWWLFIVSDVEIYLVNWIGFFV